VPLTLTPPATAADASTVTPPTFTVRVGGRVRTVDADLYRPAGVDRDHPAPAVLGTNGFGGSKSSADAADKLVLFAKLYDVAPDGTRTGCGS
jgi:hypothetical protein